VTTNTCGSDKHMVGGRTTAPVGQTLGHEITGEVVEAGDDVLFVKKGDICSVPFNMACGRCRMCKSHEFTTKQAGQQFGPATSMRVAGLPPRVVSERYNRLTKFQRRFLCREM
jgi:threonine dehydrogenase-like Zn-dependent dehydrogenase